MDSGTASLKTHCFLSVVDAARQKPRRGKQAPCTLPPSHYPCSHLAAPGLHQAAEPGRLCHPLQVVQRVDALVALFPICTYSIAEEVELASLLHGNRSEKTQRLLRLSKLPLSEWPGWRKGNSNKRAATLVPGMPLVSAYLWGRLNPRKGTHASPHPGLTPGWLPASPILVPGTASHSAHKSNGILVFPWGCHLPSKREQAQILFETKSTGCSLLLQKDRKLQNI